MTFLHFVCKPLGYIKEVELLSQMEAQSLEFFRNVYIAVQELNQKASYSYS